MGIPIRKEITATRKRNLPWGVISTNPLVNPRKTVPSPVKNNPALWIRPPVKPDQTARKIRPKPIIIIKIELSVRLRNILYLGIFLKMKYSKFPKVLLKITRRFYQFRNSNRIFLFCSFLVKSSFAFTKENFTYASS